MESSSQSIFSKVSYDLADLFNPSIFLNSVRQHTARQLGLPIDQLKLVSIWPSPDQGFEESVSDHVLTISNLQLEGALFEGGKLKDCHATSPTVSVMPDILIAWRPSVSETRHFAIKRRTKFSPSLAY